MSDNKNFWNRYSSMYDRAMKSDQKAYSIMVNKIKNELNNQMDVLELATGTGIIGIQLAGCCKTITATDFAEEMIKTANKKEKPNNMTFEVQDATNLTYPDKTFDTVVISNALHIMPNPDIALKNIKRVLKDNGKLIAPTFTRKTSKRDGVFETIAQWFGFKTYSRWTYTDYINFIESNNWHIVKSSVIDARFPIAYIVAEKIN